MSKLNEKVMYVALFSVLGDIIFSLTIRAETFKKFELSRFSGQNDDV